MGLKERLRTWLGVERLENAMENAQNEAITPETMRKEIADALEMVLSGDSLEMVPSGDRLGKYRMWSLYIPDEGLRFEKTLRRITGEQAEGVALSAVEARIGSEAFIDDLVARLRRKQLDA